MAPRKPVVEGEQHIFVILDAQVRMQPALQQDAGTSELDHLLNLFINRLEREQVTFLRSQRTIKSAERAVFGAEIGVIDVAVDLVRGYAWIGFLAAHFHRRHPDPYQVIGAKQVERFLLRYSHVRMSLSALRDTK